MPTCQHSSRRDYRYIPSVNRRQCRWCGATEQDPETPSESPSDLRAA